MMRNLSKALIGSDKIETTLPRAKELRKMVERLVTIGKRGGIHDRRRAFAVLREADLVSKLFNDLAPRYAERNGGYTRIIKLAPRRGDSAKMSIIEFV